MRCIVNRKKLLKERVSDQNIPFEKYFGENCQWGSHPDHSKPFVVEPDKLSHTGNASKYEAEAKFDDLQRVLSKRSVQVQTKNNKNTRHLNRIISFIKKQFDKERKYRKFPKLLIIVEDTDCTDPKQIKKFV